MGALIATLLAVWAAVDGNESDGGAPREAEIVSAAALRQAATEGEAPVYWAGQVKGTQLEFSRPSSGRSYVRYLPPDAEAGARQRFLTVGTYAYEDPVAALRESGKEADGVLAIAPGDGTIYFARQDPKSVYVAYPGDEVEIEVFAPRFREALELATSGRIVRVE